MQLLRFQKYSSCASTLVFFFFLHLDKHPYHTPLCPGNVIFICQKGPNETPRVIVDDEIMWAELSQDVVPPPESSSLPPAAPFAFSGAKAVWDCCQEKHQSVWHKDKHSVTHIHTDICTHTSVDLWRKHQDWHLIIHFTLCNELLEEQMLQNGRCVFVLSWRSRIFRATGFGEWPVLILDLMCTVYSFDCSSVAVWVRWNYVKCHGKHNKIIGEHLSIVSRFLSRSSSLICTPMQGCITW